MRPSRILLAVVAAMALVLASCGGGDDADTTAKTGRDETHDVSVMTRNLYLGADLMPLFEATADNLAATARATYDQVTSSDVDARMDAVAREIVDNRPDLVALQEATVWRRQAAGAAEPSEVYDFVKLLLGHLAARGATYTVASSVDGFSGGLPIEGVGTVTMQDRDVILLRGDAGVTVANPTSGTFADRMTVKIAGAPIEVVRGWTSVDATVGGRTFRFFATHLEAFDDPVRDAQEKELLGILDAAAGPTMLLGDLNSASTGKDSAAYRSALAAGLKDVWPAVNGKTPGLTCCRSADLKSGTLSERIDYVLHRGGFDPLSAEVVGTDSMSRTPGNRWASDHAGVVAALEVPAR